MLRLGVLEPLAPGIEFRGVDLVPLRVVALPEFGRPLRQLALYPPTVDAAARATLRRILREGLPSGGGTRAPRVDLLQHFVEFDVLDIGDSLRMS